jgi:hypothetical protein
MTWHQQNLQKVSCNDNYSNQGMSNYCTSVKEKKKLVVNGWKLSSMINDLGLANYESWHVENKELLGA